MDLAPGTIDVAGRRLDLDLIRAAIVAGLVFYHTAAVFSPVEFYVNNRPSSFAMTLFVFFAKLWAMPLLFLVAGAGAWSSLRTRSVRDFIRSRLRRLLVPLVVGIALVVPPQVYFSLLARNQDPGSYWQFLGNFFDMRLAPGFPSVIRGDGPDPLFQAGHLWFLYNLLVYTFLLLPLFAYLRGSSGHRVRDWLTGRVRRHGGFLLLAGPVVMIEAALGTWDPGGWNNYAYLPFLLYGFLMAADRRLAEAVRCRWKEALAVGIVTLPILFVIAHYDIGGTGRLLGSDYHPWSVLWRLLKAVAGWAWTIGIFGLVATLVQRPAKRGSSVTRSALAGQLGRYANEAVLPFYVVHQAPIVIVGFYVVQWDVGIAAKYLTISLVSFAITLAVYDLLIRRTNVTRLLFGMPRLRSGVPTPARTAVGDKR